MEIVNGYFSGSIDKLEPDQILVFGSNTEGRHGKGLALIARQKFGAIYGCSHGRQGRCYAIITKDISKNSKPIGFGFITGQFMDLFEYAKEHKDLKFLIPYTMGATNLNGYSTEELMKMIVVADRLVWMPSNIIFHESVKDCLSKLMKES